MAASSRLWPGQRCGAALGCGVFDVKAEHAVEIRDEARAMTWRLLLATTR